jgi:hypothetical protein
MVAATAVAVMFLAFAVLVNGLSKEPPEALLPVATGLFIALVVISLLLLGRTQR